MREMVMRMKSGKEMHFSCKEYQIETLKATGELVGFSFTDGIGECPIYFNIKDVESISVISKGKG